MLKFWPIIKLQQKRLHTKSVKMDVGSFSFEDFEVNEWVNKVLEDRPPETSPDAHISALSMKLQVRSKFPHNTPALLRISL